MICFVVVTFDYGLSDKYNIMSNVLIHSILKNEPNAAWVKHVLDEPKTFDKNRSFISNTIKLRYWNQELKEADDGDYIIFTDCDMVLLKPINDIFKKNFDIAYTVRTMSSYPINGGMIFVKVNERSRNFFDKFEEINNKMLNDQEFHKPWRYKYAGINQSAFGYLLENNKKMAKLLPVQCKEWNACNEDWEFINEETRALHIKGQLRKAIFLDDPTPVGFQKAEAAWRKYYNDWNSKRTDY